MKEIIKISDVVTYNLLRVGDFDDISLGIGHFCDSFITSFSRMFSVPLLA